MKDIGFDEDVVVGEGCLVDRCLRLLLFFSGRHLKLLHLTVNHSAKGILIKYTIFGYMPLASIPVDERKKEKGGGGGGKLKKKKKRKRKRKKKEKKK